VAAASVIGLVLRVDVRGWNGAPPLLPQSPVRSETGRDGAQSFHYDLLPRDVVLDTEGLCARFASRLERLLGGERSALAQVDLPFRLCLEVGLMYDDDGSPHSTRWTPDFLRVLGELDMQLTVSHYPFAGNAEPLSEDDL
jgi:hypothetical protein